MEIFKPNKNTNPCTLEHDDDFYKYSHGSIGGDYTICGVASEEWGYIEKEPRKEITCPKCLGIIRECKSYKL